MSSTPVAPLEAPADHVVHVVHGGTSRIQSVFQRTRCALRRKLSKNEARRKSAPTVGHQTLVGQTTHRGLKTTLCLVPIPMCCVCVCVYACLRTLQEARREATAEPRPQERRRDRRGESTGGVKGQEVKGAIGWEGRHDGRQSKKHATKQTNHTRVRHRTAEFTIHRQGSLQ